MLSTCIRSSKVGHESVHVVLEIISMCLKLLAAGHPVDKVNQEVKAMH